MRRLAVALATLSVLPACGAASFADMGAFTAVLMTTDAYTDSSVLMLDYDTEARGCLEFGANLEGRVNGARITLEEAGTDGHFGLDLAYHSYCREPVLRFMNPERLGTPMQLELSDGTSTVRLEVIGLGSKLEVEPPAEEAVFHAGGNVELQLAAGWQDVLDFNSIGALNEGEPRLWPTEPASVSDAGVLTVPLPPEIVPGRVTLQSSILPTTARILSCEGATCVNETDARTQLSVEVTVVP